MRLNRAARRAHKRHVKDARRWGRETQGKDWVLVKWVRDPDVGIVYVWAGPPGTGTVFYGYGTDYSHQFLIAIRSALTEYRIAFAQEMTEIPQLAMDYTI